MKIEMRRLQLFILLFAASSLLFHSSSDFEVLAASPTDISAKDAETDGENGFTMLGGARGVATFTIGSGTYAIVVDYNDDGVQIIDISDPSNIVAKDAETDGENGFTMLRGATEVATFTIGSGTYAIVTGYSDDGVQIIDISDPSNISATDTAVDDSVDSESDFTMLYGAQGVATFTIGANTYAIVTAYGEGGVQIIDISDPNNIVAKDTAVDLTGGFTMLYGAYGVATFTIGSGTYAIVTDYDDNGVQIIDISDPSNITATDTATDDTGGFTMLQGPNGVATFTIGSSTYAIVASDDLEIGEGILGGVQIIDISDPNNIVAKDAETDGENGFSMLRYAQGVATFTIGSGTYAIVTAYGEGGVQIIDISDPSNISATDTAVDDSVDSESDFTKLVNAYGVATFTIGSSTYSIVTAFGEGGVQIIALNTVSPTVTITSSSGGTCSSHIILGNCGTIAINNDEYRIINTWTNVPTTDVLVGEPVTVTLSTTNNPTHTKIHFASVYTGIFNSPTNYEQSSHVDYSVMNSKVTYVSQSQLFQVAEATHRITEDPNIKNLDRFEVVFTMIFAKPMDISHIVVEIENKFGIPETLYLTSALKVNENIQQVLMQEEKSKFELEYEPVMEPEPPMIPDVKNVTCGKGTVLKDNLCVPKEWSFLDFFEQLMKLFG